MKYGSLDGILAAKDLSATVRAKFNVGKDYIAAARTVVAPVLNCAVGDVDGVIPHGPPTPELVALAERYGIVASVARVNEALDTLSKVAD
jgi:hypothetical protein